jgi:hypothetical protein
MHSWGGMGLGGVGERSKTFISTENDILVFEKPIELGQAKAPS